MKTKSFVAQVAHFEKGKRYNIAGAGVFDPGERATHILPNVPGATLFVYLFRRFGYPSLGWDSDKELVNYLLTTPLSDVFLLVRPYMGTPSVELMFGYGMERSLERSLYKMDEPEQSPFYRAAVQALEVSMRDLLRPVYVRDMAINCYGRVSDEACVKLPKEVEPYHAAGYPVPGVFYQDGERWEKFCHALGILGKGDIDKGIDAVIEMAAREREANA